ncbi:MAG TPA: hypothetical protein VFC56_03885 [Stellaceae bacterium]|nr:hypothetical protein [Stellaceae bacterium]
MTETNRAGGKPGGDGNALSDFSGALGKALLNVVDNHGESAAREVADHFGGRMPSTLDIALTIREAVSEATQEVEFGLAAATEAVASATDTIAELAERLPTPEPPRPRRRKPKLRLVTPDA